MAMIWLVPAFPLAGFAFLILSRGLALRGRSAGVIGSAAAGLSAAAACAVAWAFASGGSAPYSARLWTWIELGAASSSIALSVDALSVIMILVVAIVGFLIHLFSIEHMAGEEDYARFFALLNLFLAFMLILVLAEDFLLLYLGWEGVGLCSFLLIGFWYRDRRNGDAARKAFITTRVGDAALLLGIILIAANLGGLGIAETSSRAQASWARGSGIAALAAALLLGGALGKSAQLPLQAWLPDAMAGPSPVSALIHAATMVTAGVYLVARANAFFALAPEVMAAVAVIGAATLLMAGAGALAQRDLKKILAYSTMSQIGYMFLALGAAAWTPAVFHLATHALFKSLLFLSAGAIIEKLGHERDVYAMGGQARKSPLLFWTFLAGALALTALPPATAGLASKDAILARLWQLGGEARLLWWAAMAGVLLTSLYTFRMIFLVFAGESRSAGPAGAGGAAAPEAARKSAGAAIAVPLVALAALCLVGGLIDFPSFLGGSPILGAFLGGALPSSPEPGAGAGSGPLLALAPLLLSLAGIPIAWAIARAELAAAGARAASPPSPLIAFVRGGFGFDGLYDRVLSRPIRRLADSGDFVDLASEGLYGLTMRASNILRSSQDGRPRRYLAVIAFGAALLVAAVFL